MHHSETVATTQTARYQSSRAIIVWAVDSRLYDEPAACVVVDPRLLQASREKLLAIIERQARAIRISQNKARQRANSSA
ncbi:MAG TPA: hypothetical protein VH210_14960 [Gaiellaceae bacterium]|nr:hypothetical protein [Gaiellaceae bacterium]